MRSKYLKKQNQYTNPFFKKKNKKKSSKINWRIQLFIFEIIMLTTGLVWFFYFSTVFQIILVDNNGTKRISKNEIIDIVFEQAKEKRFLIGSQKNILLFDLKKLEDLLNNRYLLESLTLKKEMPDKIIVSIVEKDYSAIWQEEDEYYYISETGKKINKARVEDKDHYPLITNIGKKRSDNQGARDEIERIDFILKLFDKFKDKKISIVNDRWFVVENFILDDMEYTVQMVIKICTNTLLEEPLTSTMLLSTEGPQREESIINFKSKEDCVDGPMIYFNLQEDINKHVAKLLVLFNEKLNNDLNEKAYIDLRYGDKVYYK